MTRSRTHRSHGFSLLELIMVVAVILIVAGIAIPNLVRSRLSASEAVAVSTLRLLNTAESQYAGSYNSFSQDFTSLGPPPAGVQPSSSASDFVDLVLSGHTSNLPLQFDKGGYRYTYTPTGSYPAVRQFALNADPLVRGTSGGRSFYMDQSGIIRWNGSRPANATDSPLS